jgi:hypothetical protein
MNPQESPPNPKFWADGVVLEKVRLVHQHMRRMWQGFNQDFPWLVHGHGHILR